MNLCDETEKKKDQDSSKLKLLSNSSKNEESDSSTVVLCKQFSIQMESCEAASVIPKHLLKWHSASRHFYAPTAGYLGFKRNLDMIPRKRFYWPGNCTEMSFGMSCIVAAAPCEKIRSQRPPDV
ncbi:hypothetical protein TNCV_132121 [Trichonephila clavipes]|nr:hypothetical protein TNCV_132121 [Trichonephila clavipes]